MTEREIARGHRKDNIQHCLGLFFQRIKRKDVKAHPRACYAWVIVSTWVRKAWVPFFARGDLWYTTLRSGQYQRFTLHMTPVLRRIDAWDQFEDDTNFSAKRALWWFGSLLIEGSSIVVQVVLDTVLKVVVPKANCCSWIVAKVSWCGSRCVIRRWRLMSNHRRMSTRPWDLSRTRGTIIVIIRTIWTVVLHHWSSHPSSLAWLTVPPGGA